MVLPLSMPVMEVVMQVKVVAAVMEEGPMGGCEGSAAPGCAARTQTKASCGRPRRSGPPALCAMPAGGSRPMVGVRAGVWGGGAPRNLRKGHG